MQAITRPTFVKTSLAASAAFSVLPGGRAASPNEKLLIGVLGLGGRGSYLAQAFAKRKEAEIAWLCDPDSRRLDGARKAVEAAQGRAPRVRLRLRRSTAASCKWAPKAAARPTPRKRQTTSSPANWATCTSRARSI